MYVTDVQYSDLQSVHGIFQTRILEWLFPPPGNLPDPGIEPESPALQEHSLPSGLPGKLSYAPFTVTMKY